MTYIYIYSTSTTTPHIKLSHRFQISIVYSIFVLRRIAFCSNNCICTKNFKSLPPIPIKLIRNNNSFLVTNSHMCLNKYKFHIGLKNLLLSKQLRSNCSSCELTLPKGAKVPRGPMCLKSFESQMSLFHQACIKVA